MQTPFFECSAQSKEQTKKVVTCWTRKNYLQTVPIPIVFTILKYINFIREQFANNIYHCVSTPDNLQTVKLICESPERLHICRGIIPASTEIGQYQWQLKLNQFKSLFAVGVFNVQSCKARYGLTIKKKSECAIIGWKLINEHFETKKLKRDEAARIKNGDQIQITISGRMVKFKVFNNKTVKWKITIALKSGEYKIWASLQKLQDSISIIDYKQLN